MTFTPRVVRDDEPLPHQPSSGDTAELVLPDDLAALASQLTHDAVTLSQRFPARAPRSAEVASSPIDAPLARRAADGSGGRSDAARFLGPALALIVTMAGAAGFVTTWPEPRKTTPSVQTPPEVAAPATGAASASSRNAALGPRDQHATNRDPRTAREFSPAPASFVRELTGPELEGFLDLLETHDAASTRLSI